MSAAKPPRRVDPETSEEPQEAPVEGRVDPDFEVVELASGFEVLNKDPNYHYVWVYAQRDRAEFGVGWYESIYRAEYCRLTEGGPRAAFTSTHAESGSIQECGGMVLMQIPMKRWKAIEEAGLRKAAQVQKQLTNPHNRITGRLETIGEFGEGFKAISARQRDDFGVS
jgi:hypothetical protein